MTKIPFNFTGNSLSFVDTRTGKQYTLSNKHAGFSIARQAIKDDDIETAVNAVDYTKAINAKSQGRVTLVAGQVHYDGEPIHSALTDMILKYVDEGLPFEPLTKFLEKLMQNPSNRSRTQLYGFIEKHLFAINSDGDFLAYKRIRDDYTDCYTGTIDNSVGANVKMDRGAVNDNPYQTCSHGLHVCGYSYLGSFHGNRIVLVAVNPANVVSIPSDYDHAKMRVCEYDVVQEIGEARPNDTLPIMIDIKKQTTFSGPLRDSKGRFVKSEPDVNYHNVRASNGRFAKATNQKDSDITKWG